MCGGLLNLKTSIFPVPNITLDVIGKAMLPKDGQIILYCASEKCP